MTLGSGLTCRVVSAEVKPPSSSIYHHQAHLHDKLTVSGPLEVVGVGRRYCSVIGGCLELQCQLSSKPYTRIPLRGLHLISAGWLTFRLLGQGYSLTFKAEKEDDYWRWVKCLAAELLRQTPLTSIPYLDILGITGALRRAQSEGCLSPPPTSLPDVVADTCKPRRVRPDWSQMSTPERRCESGDRLKSNEVDYLPVRERRRIWEEMSRKGPGSAVGGSLCNLSESCKSTPHLSVRQLCRLFESPTSSLPPRLSSMYIGMKENIPTLYSSQSADVADETTRGRKQFRLSDMKLRHHSNIR